MLKIGDKIRMNDRSYAFGVKDGKYSEFPRHKDKGPFTVVEVDLLVARKSSVREEELGHPATVSDILLTDDNGGFWFVPSNYTELIIPKHTIIIDGNPIEISDESFEALKKQLLR